jgi:restriction endonuclease S subunit
MNYKNFTFSSDLYQITHIRKKYTKTKNGAGQSWRAVPVEEISETVTAKFYENFVQSIPFFNSRAEYSYTTAGYIPVKITTVSPYEPIKYIDTFEFNYIGG